MSLPKLMPPHGPHLLTCEACILRAAQLERAGAYRSEALKRATTEHYDFLTIVEKEETQS